MQMRCPCFYPDPLPESTDSEFESDRCACGHALDEHDDTGQCQAVESVDKGEMT